MSGDAPQTWSYAVYVGGRKVADSTQPVRVDLVRAARRWGPGVLAVVLVGLAAFLMVTALDSYAGPLWLALPLQAVGVPYILGGAVLWAHRPANYLGPVCMLLGASWYLGDLQAFGSEALFVVGFAGYFLNVAVFTHLALMVPHGKLVGPVDRGVVVALYVMIPSTQLLRYLDVRALAVARTGFGDVLAYPSPWARVATVLGAVLAVVAMASAIRNYRRATTVQRRSFSPFWAAAAIAGATASTGAVLEFSQARLLQQFALLGYAVAMIAAAVGLIVGAVAASASAFDAWLAGTGGMNDLERAIGTAAGDPTLRCFVRDGDGWCRGSTVTAEVPPTEPGSARTTLDVNGRSAVVIVHDRELAYQRPLLQAVATMTVTAMARLRQTQERNEAVVDAQHAERYRISRDLHDGVQTMLSAVVRGLHGTALRYPSAPDHVSWERLADTAQAVQARLVQIVHDVYPKEIRDGLAVAVRVLLDNVEPGRAGIEVIADVANLRPAAERVQLEAYFLISEALQNAVAHSGGTRVWISVAEVPGALRIAVEDDGRGWVPAPGGARRGNGVPNMQARVGLLDGVLDLGPSEHGGAAVRALLPVPVEERESRR